MRLLVVGDTLLDRDIIGRVERISPDAPVPVVDVEAVHDRPGGAGLAALLANRSGVEVVLATGLGPDAAGRRVRALLAAAGVKVHDVVPAATTPGKTRVRAAGQSLLRLDDAGHLLGSDEAAAAGLMTPADDPVAAQPTSELPAALLRLAAGCDAILVADYGGAVSADTGVRDAIAELATQVPVVWDPHPRGLGPVPGCTVVTPNRNEALVFAGTADELAAGPSLRTRWQADAVTVTLGSHGVSATSADGQVAIPAGQCPPGVDTCGAGDRYAGALALALAAGAALDHAVEVAVADVAAWLSEGGVSTLAEPSPAASALDAPRSAPAVRPPARPAGPARPAPALSGMGAQPASADEVVAAVRARGGTVVATGGCFDVLHAGHLSLLQSARALGDTLVVLVNSDASVRRLKGPTRPVHSAADRARLLEALTCVDAVAVFEDDDPVATLERLRPDVWVKGGDYTAADLPEAAVVESAGGHVVLVPLLQGHSTSRIVSGRVTN